MRITTRQFSIQYHWGTRSLTTDIDKFSGFLSFLCSEDFFIQIDISTSNPNKVIRQWPIMDNDDTQNKIKISC